MNSVLKQVPSILLKQFPAPSPENKSWPLCMLISPCHKSERHYRRGQMLSWHVRTQMHSGKAVVRAGEGGARLMWRRQ